MKQHQHEMLRGILDARDPTPAMPLIRRIIDLEREVEDLLQRLTEQRSALLAEIATVGVAPMDLTDMVFLTTIPIAEVAPFVGCTPAQVPHRVPPLLTKCSVCNRDQAISSRAAIQRYFNNEMGSCKECRKEAYRRSADRSRASFDMQRQEAAERTERLRTMPYREYLQTDHWKEVRTAALRRAKFRCSVCNAGGLLDVHHRTYERRGAELAADLTVLCRDCHYTFHREGKLA